LPEIHRPGLPRCERPFRDAVDIDVDHQRRIGHGSLPGRSKVARTYALLPAEVFDPNQVRGFVPVSGIVPIISGAMVAATSAGDMLLWTHADR